MVTGPIIIVEDDKDDMFIIEEIFNEFNIPNKVIWFQSGIDAFNYLASTTEQPFLILCDVNMPGQNGINFKMQLDSDDELKRKSIPFVFFSTSTDQKYVDDAYTLMTVQGYFKKGDSYAAIRKALTVIIEYWKLCKHPNSK